MRLQKTDITDYIREDNILSFGKETTVYYYQDKVIKLFHKRRNTTIPRISDLGLEKLCSLSLNCFNSPIDLIMENGNIIGYTEKLLLPEEINIEGIDFELIKQDIKVLSENGFQIEDLFYNYIFHNGKLYFMDLTCYHYMEIKEAFLKKHFYKKNIKMMNTFLIGLIEFDAFRIGATYELTKIYLANEFERQHCQNEYYGDYLSKTQNIKKIAMKY